MRGNEANQVSNRREDNRVIKVHFGPVVPQVHWVDVKTGQLSFVFDVPSFGPNVMISPSVVCRSLTTNSFVGRSHDALERREG